MTEQENRELVEQYIRCIHEGNTEELLNLIHDDFVEQYPQSGEQIRGKDNFQKFYENFEGLPNIEGYNLHMCGDLCVLEMLLNYPDGDIYNACEIVQFQDGKIANIKAYFAEPFEAPEWRSEWVEMMGDTTEETYEQRPTART